MDLKDYSILGASLQIVLPLITIDATAAKKENISIVKETRKEKYKRKQRVWKLKNIAEI